MANRRKKMVEDYIRTIKYISTVLLPFKIKTVEEVRGGGISFADRRMRIRRGEKMPQADAKSVILPHYYTEYKIIRTEEKIHRHTL